MASMLDQVKSSKVTADTLHVLVRENQVTCHNSRLASFLRAVVPLFATTYLSTFTHVMTQSTKSLAYQVHLRQISCLAAAPFHAELSRIIRALFRKQHVSVLAETRVVSSSDTRYDLWLKSSLVEFGIEIKTECDNKPIQKERNLQIAKYASCREPQEMMVVNFVRKEVDSVTFPINIQPIGWDKYPKMKFTVLFVNVIGNLESGVSFRYAINGDESWRQFS
ncbi:hypothetical protein BDR26DRAFT_981906 [Obelidium mucronatum]|nr:hypothetical protein BDR26DRAFT_981906 [Obelidium mucronatum]